MEFVLCYTTNVQKFLINQDEILSIFEICKKI